MYMYLGLLCSIIVIAIANLITLAASIYFITTL